MPSNNYDVYKSFNLIELLIALSLILSLLVATIPLGRQLYISNYQTALANRVVAAIYFARYAAILHGQKVRICPKAKDDDCAFDWAKGIIIITGKHKITLRTYVALPQEFSLVFLSSRGLNNYLEFLPTGMTNGQDGSFYLCRKKLTAGKRIVVSPMGRVRVSDIKCKG